MVSCRAFLPFGESHQETIKAVTAAVPAFNERPFGR
jgi:hypothetical protein